MQPKSHRFSVPGLPIAQPRQRQRQLATGVTMNYTPTRHPVNAFKASCRHAWSVLVGEEFPPLVGPIHLELTFVMPRPTSMQWKKKAMPRDWHVVVPDDDNMEKAVRDGLNQLVWRDDRQICSKIVRKVIASGSEMPRTLVVVTDLTDVLPDSWRCVASGGA